MLLIHCRCSSHSCFFTLASVTGHPSSGKLIAPLADIPPLVPVGDRLAILQDMVLVRVLECAAVWARLSSLRCLGRRGTAEFGVARQ